MNLILKFIKNNTLYFRDELTVFSKKIDADLASLCEQKSLIKNYHGLYSKTGSTISNEQLIKKILAHSSGSMSLIISNKNCPPEYVERMELDDKTYLVLNKRRSDLITTNEGVFRFQIPFNGFPKKISKEFIHIYLMNIKSKKKEHFIKFADSASTSQLAALFECGLKYGNKSTQKFLRASIKQRNQINEISIHLARLGAPLIISSELKDSKLPPMEATEVFSNACELGMSEPRIHNILHFTLLKNIEKLDISKFAKLTKENNTYRYAGFLLDMINTLSNKNGPSLKTPKYSRTPLIIFKNTYSPRGIKRIQKHHFEMAEKKWGIIIDTSLEREKEKIRKWS